MGAGPDMEEMFGELFVKGDTNGRERGEREK